MYKKKARMSKGGSQSYPKSIEAEVHSVFCCLTGWPAPPPSPRASLSPPGAPSRIPAAQAPPPPPPLPVAPPFPAPPVWSSAASCPVRRFIFLCCMRVAQARYVCRLLPPSSSPHPSTNIVKGRPSRTRIRYLPSVVKWGKPAPVPPSSQMRPPALRCAGF
jgi:hypothetical protein